MQNEAVSNCLFCRISQREVSADVVWEDEQTIAFKDIHPKAPVHILVIPKKHIVSLADASEEDTQLLGHLLLSVKHIAEQQKIDSDGYRVVISTRNHGGQEVDHLHLHILGGEPLGPMRAAQGSKPSQ
jgi:histidine triad (HIT) family protein